MALPHASPGQVIDISPLGDQLRQQCSIALFKSVEIEVLRLVLPAGEGMPPHKVQGEITIQCLEGVLDVVADGSHHVLTARTLLFLQSQSLHSLKAREDASVLLTVVLKPGAAPELPS